MLLIMSTISSASESSTENKNMVSDTNIQTVPQILAVSASGRDSDNSFKAAQALLQKAEELGVSIKIEIHENNEITDPLTAEEISRCKGIIVATDTNIVLKRFANKQVLVTTTSQAINEPEKLIKTILNNEASVAQTEIPETVTDQKKTAETRQYPFIRLMESFGSIMPLLVAGSLMLVIAMLLSQNSSSLSLFFKTVGDIIFAMFIPILAAYIAYLIAGKDGALIGFIGGAVAQAGYSLAWLSDPGTLLYSSGLFGAMVAGVTAGYISSFLQKLCSKMPSSLKFIRADIIYPIIGILIISAVMFSLNGPLSGINQSIIKNLESAGINEGILAIIILFITVTMTLITPRFIKKQDN